MPAIIHPPVHLRIVLDEENYAGGDDAEMARRFTAVAPTEVVRAAKGSQRANVLRFDLGSDGVAAAAEDSALWRDALVSWLDEEFDETSSLVVRENDAREHSGQHPVPFTWAEVKFGTEPVIAIRMKESTIPAEAAGFVARARELLAQGAFGADPIASIRIPACESIEAQQAHFAAGDERAAATDEPLEAVAEEERGSSSASDVVEALSEAAGMDDGAADGWSAAAPDEQNAWAGSAMSKDGPSRAELDEALAEAEAALRHGDDPTNAEAESIDSEVGTGPVKSVLISQNAQGKNIEDAPQGEGDNEKSSAVRGSKSSEACALEAGAVPDDLDYRIWNIAYADGTSVRFDSVLGEALLD